jgi:hypothetical protein
MERFVSLGAFGGVVRSRPATVDERLRPQHGRARRPGDRAGRLTVAFVGLVVLIVVGGMLGRLVYQVVERPRTVVVTTLGCPLAGSDGVKAGDAFEMWAYPYGKVLASATQVQIMSANIAQAGSHQSVLVYFEVDRHTPDFQIADTTATEYSGAHSYAEVVAAAPHALTIDLCERNHLVRSIPRSGTP